jgi:SpoVK/Ycf46/Vps4 family AAA+-type ATPase
VPSANQIKALLKSHLSGDIEQFYAIAMQMAAHEARLGHGKLAQEIRDLIDRAKAAPPGPRHRPVPLVQPRGELSGLLAASYPQLRLADMVLAPSVGDRLRRLVREHAQVQRLRAHGLAPRKKLLLVGPPGTGKTLTASVLAGELGLPLFVVRLDSVMTKYMGETASKLRLVFDAIQETRGVYLFDEFDSIGAGRGLGNDVGEVRRVLNSFLQFIEQDDSDSLLLAATNHPDLLDHALFRRFDDVIEFHLPEEAEIITLVQTKLAAFETEELRVADMAKAAKGLSHGDIARACEDAIKEAILHERTGVAGSDLLRALEERQRFRKQ